MDNVRTVEIGQRFRAQKAYSSDWVVDGAFADGNVRVHDAKNPSDIRTMPVTTLLDPNLFVRVEQQV